MTPSHFGSPKFMTINRRWRQLSNRIYRPNSIPSWCSNTSPELVSKDASSENPWYFKTESSFLIHTIERLRRFTCFPKRKILPPVGVLYILQVPFFLNFYEKYAWNFSSSWAVRIKKTKKKPKFAQIFFAKKRTVWH